MTELPRIVRDRLKMQASGQVDLHPDADLLTAFSERTLTENERQQVMAHLALCTDCRHAVALAAPPQPAEVEQLHPEPKAHGYGWVHWFALAASVVVVAAAVLQIPRATQQSSELEVATTERPAAAAPEAQPAGKAGETTDQLTSVNEPAQVATQPSTKAEGYESRPAPAMDDKYAFKTDQASSPAAADAIRENKQQAEVLRQRQAVPGRTGDLQTGSGGGVAAGAASRSAPAAGRGVVGGIGVAAGPGTGRVDAPAAPPPAPSAANQVVVGSVEENRRAAEAPGSKDSESEKSELAATLRDEDQARVAGEPSNETGRKEAATEGAYRQPEDLPMKKHPAEQETTAAKAGSPSLRAMTSKLKAPLRWTISSAGRVLRSLDGGENWQEVAIAPEVRFRAIAVQDASVWAGGDGGALFHSVDGGQTWKPRSLLSHSFEANEQKMPAGARFAAQGYDIVRIDIIQDGRVQVTTSQKQSFVSADQGQTWSQQ